MISELPITPERLVHDIAVKMRSANLELNPSNTDWTRELKETLRTLFQSQGTKVTEVLYSHSESDNHEFLLDIVVWDRSSGEGVMLAVESEWTQSSADIAEDFWKLMVVKSPMKLMMFALNKNATIHTQDAVWNTLSDCLLKYRDHQKGERYVFMDYAPAPGRKAWWIEIPADGRLAAVPDRHWITFD